MDENIWWHSRKPQGSPEPRQSVPKKGSSWAILKQLHQNLCNLQEIMQKADPASGISFHVRRGVMDDPGNPDGRPVVEVESGDLETCQEAVKCLIKATKDSIKFWTKQTEKDIADASKILNEIRDEQKGE